MSSVQKKTRNNVAGSSKKTINDTAAAATPLARGMPSSHLPRVIPGTSQTPSTAPLLNAANAENPDPLAGNDIMTAANADPGHAAPRPQRSGAFPGACRALGA